MAHKRKTYRYRNAVEVEEYHTGRYGAPGQKRKEKAKPTPEQMEKVNQRNTGSGELSCGGSGTLKLGQKTPGTST